VSFGRDERINEKGIYALGGYVHEKGEQPFIAKYQDMSDIPDYYRITSPPELPDPQTDFKEMVEYGYTNLGMLPLYNERALDLYDKNTEIYLLYEDNTEAAAETREEIEKFDGLLGIETEAWDNYKARENTYTICQLKDDHSTRAYRFEPYDRVKAAGRVVDYRNYDRIYTAPLTPEITADEIFRKFNIDRPADFKGHSLSVSDVIVFNRDGNETTVYVDTFGFKDVPEFFHLENPLETAEKSTEQNYNQIDGIINNQPSEGEREATEKSKTKPSIKDQLKENMAQQRKAAPEKKDKNKAKAPELEV
jgi:DNA repair protein RadC